MAGQSAGLSSTSFTVCFVKLEVSQWIACLTNWRFYPGFVKLNWFMLDKPLGFQWFCQAKFRSKAGSSPIYSISAWQTDDSITDLSSYIDSCLTNLCVSNDFVKLNSGQMPDMARFIAFRLDKLTILSRICQAILVHAWQTGVFSVDLSSTLLLTPISACHFHGWPFDLSSRSPLTPTSACHFQLPGPDLTSRPPLRPHPAWQIHLPHPDLSSRHSSRAHLTYRAD